MESFSHLKLTCQRKLSIVRSIVINLVLDLLMLTIVLFDIPPQKILKSDLVDLKSLQLHHIG
jgi:predicted transglutaminase-like protease